VGDDRGQGFREGFDVLAPEAELDAELGEWRGEGAVVPEGVEIAGGVRVGQEGPLAEREGDAGDGDDRKKGHLEAGLEEARGREQQDAEQGGAEGVEDAAGAGEQASSKEDGGHQERALDGGSEAGEERIGGREGDGEEGRGDGVQTQAAGEPEEGAGEKRDVHPGDDEEVEGAGALEAETKGVGEAVAVAEEHGVEHAGVVGGEAEEAGKAAVGGREDEGGEAARGPALGAIEGAAEVALAAWIGSDGETRGADAGLGADALGGEVVGVLPGAGIAVALGRAQARGDLDEVAAVESGQGAIACIVEVIEDRQTNAAGRREQTRAVGRDLLDCGEVEVEGEDGGSFGLLPRCLVLVGVEVGVGTWVSGCGRVRGELADADDVAFDGAGEAVGEGLEGDLRGRRGLELGGPEAGKDPEGEDGKQGAMRGAAQAEDGEGEETKRRGEERDGRAEVGAGPGKADAHGEADRGGEQWHAAEAERLEGGVARGSVWPGIGCGQRR